MATPRRRSLLHVGPATSRIEVFNRRGKHLGAANPDTGVMIKDAKPGRRNDV